MANVLEKSGVFDSQVEIDVGIPVTNSATTLITAVDIYNGDTIDHIPVVQKRDPDRVGFEDEFTDVPGFESQTIAAGRRREFVSPPPFTMTGDDQLLIKLSQDKATTQPSWRVVFMIQ